MIPTLLGVIIITFVLFNIVGGSPALTALGKNVSPKRLEEFDEQRGRNKPLFLGLRTTTRAFDDQTFEHNAGAWQPVDGVAHVPATNGQPSHIVLPSGATYNAPLAFALRAHTRYEWKLRYRTGGTSPASGSYMPTPEAPVSIDIPASTEWRTLRLPFATGTDPGALDFTFTTQSVGLDIQAMSLRRRTRHLFDSQFFFYLWQLARLDFGVSHATNQRVSTMIKDGILPSLSLAVPALFAGVIAAISLSLLCAFFRGRFIDRFFVVIAVALMSINYLVWIVGAQFIFSYKLGWFPIWGYESPRYLLLPILIGVVSGLGGSLRFYRTVMLDEMYRDYVRTAFAKGVSRRGVLFKHVLKNAMIPIITNLVMAVAFLYTGSFLLESFFGIPGLGYMGINAFHSSDVDVLRALVFVGAVLFMIANLIADLCYALVDPRVRLQ